jgi:hypothetical protein
MRGVRGESNYAIRNQTYRRVKLETTYTHLNNCVISGCEASRSGSHQMAIPIAQVDKRRGLRTPEGGPRRPGVVALSEILRAPPTPCGRPEWRQAAPGHRGRFSPTTRLAWIAGDTGGRPH